VNYEKEIKILLLNSAEPEKEISEFINDRLRNNNTKWFILWVVTMVIITLSIINR